MGNFFGTVTLSGNAWEIDCEPQVRARLKRVFPRINLGSVGHIKLHRTPESSRELQWFLLRFPMEVDRPDLMEADAQVHQETEQRLARLLSGLEPPPKVELAIPPKAYQPIVGDYLDVRGGLLLGDDVGTGKTVSVFCLTTQPRRLPCVVVMPPALLKQWEKEAGRFVPGLSVYTVKDGTPKELSELKPSRWLKAAQPSFVPGRFPDLILISYFVISKWSAYLSKFVMLAVFEEVHRLCSATSDIYAHCKYLADAASQRIGLSATPVTNYGGDYFNVNEILTPGVLGTQEEFLREWCTKSEAGHYILEDSSRFGAYIRREGLMLRRTREELGTELPKLNKFVYEISADTNILNKHSGNAVELAKIILSRGKQEFTGQRFQASREFEMIMRQATGLSKAGSVAALVRLLCENGEKVVLYGWHRAVYDIWLEKLKDLNPLMFTGSENPKAKAENLDKFITVPDHKVLIMSVRSGEGVDGIQKVCRTSVIGELDWSAARYVQIFGRTHRDGQESESMAYVCIADDGSDPAMAHIVGIKRDQLDGIRDPNSFLVERVDDAEQNIKAIARSLLESRGIPVPESDFVEGEDALEIAS